MHVTLASHDGATTATYSGQPVCEWFARCDRPAALLVPHVALDMVPACERCAEWATAPTR